MTQPTTPLPVDFVTAEDEALRAWLKGMQVSDGTSPTRRVGVYFGMPDPEIRNQNFPFITLDLLTVAEGKSRVHGRYSPLSYPHAGIPQSDDTQVVKTWFPTPMELVYQVASFARQPRHDRSILSQMTTTYLHPRFAQMAANDNTSRRIEVLSFAKRDTTENSKRLFRNVWTIKVISEFFYAPVDLIPRATQVIINPSDQTPTPPDGFTDTVIYP